MGNPNSGIDNRNSWEILEDKVAEIPDNERTGDFETLFKKVVQILEVPNAEMPKIVSKVGRKVNGVNLTGVWSIYGITTNTNLPPAIVLKRGERELDVCVYTKSFTRINPATQEKTVEKELGYYVISKEAAKSRSASRDAIGEKEQGAHEVKSVVPRIKAAVEKVYKE